MGSIQLPPINLTTTGSELGGAASALERSAPAAGPYAGFVMAAAAVLKLFSNIFHGANPLQVPAAHTEQYFEVASDNCAALVEGGMISPAQASAIIDDLVAQLAAAERSMNLGAPADAAIANGTKGMRSTQSRILTSDTNIPITREIDITVAHSLYRKQVAGWYSDVMDVAGQIVDKYLAQLPLHASVLSGIDNAISSLTGTSPSGALASSTWLKPALIIGGAILLLKVLL